MGPHDMVGLHRLDIGNRALNKLRLRTNKMETSHDRVHLLRAGDSSAPA